MARTEKWYLIIPSKDKIVEWNGTVYKQRNYREVTPRGKVYEYTMATILPNEQIYNYFVKGLSNAKALSKYIINKYKIKNSMDNKLECYEDLINDYLNTTNQKVLTETVLIPMRQNFFEYYNDESEIIKPFNVMELDPFIIGEKPTDMDDIILLSDETISKLTGIDNIFGKDLVISHEFIYAKGGNVSFYISNNSLKMFVNVDVVRIGYDFSKFWTEVCYLYQKMYSVCREKCDNYLEHGSVYLTINKAVMCQENWKMLSDIESEDNIW